MATVELESKQDYEPTVDVFVDILSGYVGLLEVETIIEVGARDCVETVAFAHKFPNAHIYTFECNPATLPICERAISGYPNITLIPKAVSDTEGTLSFFQFEDAPGASSLHRFHSSNALYEWQESDQNEVEVEATTLRHFIEDRRLSSIDVLWMDIQGGELSALKGLGDRLRGVRSIFTEVKWVRAYQGQPGFWRLWRYVRRRGFLLRGFPYFSGYFGDAVFINREMLGRKDRWLLQLRELGALARMVLPLVGIGRYRDRLRRVLQRARST